MEPPAPELRQSQLSGIWNKRRREQQGPFAALSSCMPPAALTAPSFSGAALASLLLWNLDPGRVYSAADCMVQCWWLDVVCAMHHEQS